MKVKEVKNVHKSKRNFDFSSKNIDLGKFSQGQTVECPNMSMRIKLMWPQSMQTSDSQSYFLPTKTGYSVFCLS